MELAKLLEKFRNGIVVGEFVIKSSLVEKGRFAEEYNLKIKIHHGDSQMNLMFIKIFTGRPPYYSPWIELFNIVRSLRFNNVKVKFFDSHIEDKLIEETSNHLPNGAHIFVEYMNDDMTRIELIKGVPPPFTRMGYKLLSYGFTWFKDWYYPEGQNEGNPKLQAGKPINDMIKRRQLKIIEKEAKLFLSKTTENRFSAGAKRRAKEVLKDVISALNKID